jgi:hypothetical protein
MSPTSGQVLGHIQKVTSIGLEIGLKTRGEEEFSGFWHKIVLSLT